MFRASQKLAAKSITLISLSYRRHYKLFYVVIYSLLVIGCSGNDDTTNGSGEILYGPTATLTWNAPTTTVDDECLTNLSGYNIHYGNTSGQYENVETLSLSSGAYSCEQINFSSNCSEEIHVCSYTVTDLTEGTWFFAIQAYDAQGNTSGLSNEASKTIHLL